MMLFKGHILVMTSLAWNLLESEIPICFILDPFWLSVQYFEEHSLIARYYSKCWRYAMN